MGSGRPGRSLLLPGTMRLKDKLTSDFWLGAGVIAFGAFQVFYLIPTWVTSPGNVRIAVLSPTIWPNIVSVALMLIGGILLVRALLAGPEEPTADSDEEVGLNGWLRIGLTGLIMAALFLSLPILGMPIAGALAIMAYSLLVRSGRPVATIIVAILLPLIIYTFFSKIAGVPIPQGELLRLP